MQAAYHAERDQTISDFMLACFHAYASVGAADFPSMIPNETSGLQQLSCSAATAIGANVHDHQPGLGGL